MDEMTRTASADDRSRSVFRATQSENDEVAKDNKKYLAVSTTKAEVIKTAGETQEHQITFVASSANADRARKIVEIGRYISAARVLP